MRHAIVAPVLLAVVMSGCGSEDRGVEVFAAASLREVFTQILPEATFNFAGSDQLATQIREGATPDVYAAAGPRYPTELADEGLVIDPVPFATSRLVIIVPRDNPAGIGSWRDLLSPGVKLVVGGEGVPVGDYTHSLLAELDALAAYTNVVSEEQDVKEVVGKVALGEADAGICYATDVAPVEDDVLVIDLPESAQPEVEYMIAVVATSENREAAQAFIQLVTGERGQAALSDAGYGVP